MSSAIDGQYYNLVSSLAVDGVLTVLQAARHASLEEIAAAAASGIVHLTPDEVRPTARTREPLRVTVVHLAEGGIALAREMGFFPHPPVKRKMAHALGLAELRHAAGISPREILPAPDLEALWSRLKASGHGLPDGLAARPEKLVALEYDHGSYKAAQVKEKVELTCRSADKTIWGAPGLARARWLRKQGAGHVMVVRIPI